MRRLIPPIAPARLPAQPEVLRTTDGVGLAACSDRASTLTAWSSVKGDVTAGGLLSVGRPAHVQLPPNDGGSWARPVATRARASSRRR